MSTHSGKLSFTSIQPHLPAEWKEVNLRPLIKQMNEAPHKKIIVLDDDPTGVQTVHDIDVLTQWDKELLRETFEKQENVFYILTNTRGLDAAAAERINREIAENVQAVASETGTKFVFVSRSDSTLRGYYPLETDTLSETMNRLTGKEYDGHLIIPAFFEGGRITYENTHYILDGDTMLPAHESEFAKDKVFGYKQGDLTKWVAEKTEGRFQPEDCFVITLDQLRSGPDAVEEALMKVQGNRPVIINALSYSDLDVLSLALLRAESKGKSFIFRTAASFVKSYGGIPDLDYLPKEKLIAKGQEAHGGLIVVGSYVQKTTRQLEHLLNNSDIVPLQLIVEKILDPTERLNELKRIIDEVNERLAQGENVVVYSSRRLVAVDNKAENLQISRTVSTALVQIVQSLKAVPKFIIAKGGITSSDIATKGLNIRKARVLGQVSAGVPVWLTGDEAKFSGIPYIVFPGNVGTDDTLLDTVLKIES
ncbi:four-carbon acid sugar kinase family protein [Paenibacillus radicis (ex Xue et al. 2023)]|uniref:Hydroxyacid dehydrogenase n=1 Tax=Paenibacillus radicis (ex Xue et al. 2023) TaxID=2972489 RepID=A0ABT1YDN8_9BACL|nr:four-carbon acid sugar kinase family protein [Paenibacillus radicis (ex Xue et al. 2023)]MCR8631301.1 hydroxyacid dehydrogenase [Paenibacillus radicis (ex Xue et al. 2023)]